MSPVSLALRGELVDGSTNKTLDFAVEFRGESCGSGSERGAGSQQNT